MKAIPKKPLDIECPYCQARPKKPCYRIEGPFIEVKTHKARIDDFSRQLRLILSGQHADYQ